MLQFWSCAGLTRKRTDVQCALQAHGLELEQVLQVDSLADDPLDVLKVPVMMIPARLLPIAQHKLSVNAQTHADDHGVLKEQQRRPSLPFSCSLTPSPRWTFQRDRRVGTNKIDITTSLG